MVRRVFIDVGAHFGEVLFEILKPKYGFERVICIEPSKLGEIRLRKFSDKRVEIHNWAAWDSNGEKTLYSAGSVGGSLFEDKPQHWDSSEVVKTRDFKDFFDSNFNESHEIYMKLNIEGAEYFVLRHLFSPPNKSWKIESILLSIDLPKVPSLKSKRNELLDFLEKNQVRFDYRNSSDPAEAAKLWLDSKFSLEKVSPRLWLRYFSQVPKFYVIRKLLRPVFPKRIWLWLAKTFGPNRRSLCS